jgi:hypothetical protein
VAGFYERGSEASASIKCGESFIQVRTQNISSGGGRADPEAISYLCLILKTVL